MSHASRTGRRKGATPQASAFLEQLLRDEVRYRRTWERRADRPSRRGVNRSAVSRVLAEHLDDIGERRIDDERRLLDLVCRALDGRVLTGRTITWFVDAFNLERPHAEALWALFSGTAGGDGRVVIGESPPPPGPTASYRTVAVHEFHTIGADRRPVQHEGLQVIEALADGVDHYTYRCDTAEIELTAVRGGTIGPLVPETPGIYRSDLRFPRSLAAGETHSFAFRVEFRYRSPPASEFRRSARSRVENLELRVEFHPAAVPATVHWTVWDELDGPPRYEAPVEIDADHAVHRYLAFVERAVVGFTWDW